MNEPAKKKDLALVQRDLVQVVSDRIGKLVSTGSLELPANYSATNALKAAWLALQSTTDKNGQPALTVCTRDSIANSLLDMIVQGLNPAKDQCYFVVYGKKLVCLRSYFGDEALLRRVHPEARVFAEPVYKGDTLEYEIVRGKKMVTKHQQKLENVGRLDTIVAAYAVIEPGPELEPHCEIMTIEQIEQAWSRGQNWPPQKGKENAHTKHPEEFVKKTVIARACKRMINSSDDSYLVRAIERQAHLAAEAEIEARIEEEANKDVLSFPANDAAKPGEVIDADEEGAEGGASSPSARFLDLIDARDLDPSKARKLAAKIHELDDVRKLTNEHCAEILEDVDAFLALYEGEYSKPSSSASQGKLGGPGF